jgi:hypothetical protein
LDDGRGLAAQLKRVAEDLVQRLGETCTVTKSPVTTDRGPIATIWQGAPIVELTMDGDRIAVSLPWDESPSAWIEADVASAEELELVARAIEGGRRRLTARSLVPGERYEVVSDTHGLRAGAAVTFVKFDDIDNHFGRLEFLTDAGEKIFVEGDFSSVRSPPAQVHRYLKRVHQDE